MAEWVVEITDGLPHLKNMKPLIRCKDCDYYTPSEKRCWNERITADGIIEPDWFCADGEVATVKDGANKDSGDVKDG